MRATLLRQNRNESVNYYLNFGGKTKKKEKSYWYWRRSGMIYATNLFHMAVIMSHDALNKSSPLCFHGAEIFHSGYFIFTQTPEIKYAGMNIECLWDMTYLI